MIKVLTRAGRRTNLALLWLLLAAFLTGWVCFATARPLAATIATAAHGICALGVLILAPWKSVVITRAPKLRVLSLLLLALVLAVLGAGFVQLFAGFVLVGGLSPIQVHVGSTLIALPLLIVHVLRHRGWRLRRTDFARRRVLRGGATLATAGAAYAVAGTVAQASVPSRPPAATGSRSLDPDAIPATIWLLDRVPVLAADHPVVVAGRSFTPTALAGMATDVVARLDCTSGWYARATWRGVPLSALIPAEPRGVARSLRVISTTGYERRFPVQAADRLWLATGCQGRPLTTGTGAPVRLVAPGHRGFWWVKWVDRVELDPAPAWWQSPFPLQ